MVFSISSPLSCTGKEVKLKNSERNNLLTRKDLKGSLVTLKDI